MGCDDGRSLITETACSRPSLFLLVVLGHLLGAEHNLLAADSTRPARDAKRERVPGGQLRAHRGQLEDGPRRRSRLLQRNVHLGAEDTVRRLFGVDGPVQRQVLDDALVARQVQVEVDQLGLERDLGLFLVAAAGVSWAILGLSTHPLA